ncbi:MAG: hypothetical protein KDI37_18800, partial [Xanthomonadales bacterium]|nr:hypothetical protein [Xanthomonadales bacterium]
PACTDGGTRARLRNRRERSDGFSSKEGARRRHTPAKGSVRPEEQQSNSLGTDSKLSIDVAP